MQIESSERSTPHPIDVEMGARVREQRKVQGLSQVELGQRLGLTFQQVQKYENGLNRIAVSRLWMIAQALNVPLGHLVRDLPGSLESEETGVGQDDSVRLVKAWRRLRSPNHRAAIIDLVERLGDDRTSQG